MPFFDVIKWIVWKDTLSEVRNRDNFSSLLFFALNVIFIFSFSFSTDREMIRTLLPGLIWVAFSFTSLLGLPKSFLSETQNDCLSYLQSAPVSKGAIYLGKCIGNLLLLLVVESVLLPLLILFFNLDMPHLRHLFFFLLVSILATVGLSSLGTFFSALTVKTRAREVLFPLLLLPLSIPVLISAVEATGSALRGDPFFLYQHWVELLIVFDLVVTLVLFWMFEFVLED